MKRRIKVYLDTSVFVVKIAKKNQDQLKVVVHNPLAFVLEEVFQHA